MLGTPGTLEIKVLMILTYHRDSCATFYSAGLAEKLFISQLLKFHLINNKHSLATKTGHGNRRCIDMYMYDNSPL